METYDTSQDFEHFEGARRAHAPGFFTPGLPVHLARAPGRLDVMGGIADYSGSLVAEMPIAQAAVVGVQAGGTDDGTVVVRSLNAQTEGLTPEVTLPADLFINPVSLLKRVLSGPREEVWAGYVAGAYSILRAEGLLPKRAGARFLVHSDVPIGAGVSSSAALEVASMRALASAFGISLDGITLARYSQRVENEIVDAPCGIMDQVTGALGEAGKLLLLLCQPYQVQGSIELPTGWTVFGVDSAVKHSIGGRAYTNTRVAAFMGFKIIADRAGAGFGGYLCNVSPDEYRAVLPNGVPDTMSGAAFLGNHGGIFDTVTAVEPGETYHVRAATEHAIFENDRVREFVRLLEQSDKPQDGNVAPMIKAGKLMYESHASYSRCGLGSPETDLLVELAEQQENVAGAKITGGGSGGTVCVLCEETAVDRVAQNIITAYETRTGNAPHFIRGTSPGAMMTPTRIVEV